MSATLLDPDYLAAGLEASVAQHTAANQLRQDRLAANDRELATQRRRLDDLAGKLGEAGEGEFAAALLRQAKEIEALIARLSREREELAAMRTEGLSTDDADALTAFASEIRAGLAEATPADRRRLYELLQVRETIHLDPDGIKLGRKHAYRVDWQASIPLPGYSSRFK